MSLPVPNRSNWRGLWLVPLLVSALFVAGVTVWAYRAEDAERQERKATLIADALSAEAQLLSRLELESDRVKAAARALPRTSRDMGGLAGSPEVAEGLRRLWLSATWLDGKNRIVAHVPEQQPEAVGRDLENLGNGQTLHLSAAAGDEQLIVRLLPGLLLRRATPWWIARKYDVQLIDASDQIFASIDDLPLRLESPGRESYKVEIGDDLPGIYLELTERVTQQPFWRTLPLVLMAGFLSLMAVATYLLRRQVRRISQAEAAWRTQAAWREAMEDSALVGLRARDAEGRILYVNRTLCDMVGYSAEELVGLKPPMPYWPPDAIDEGMQRSSRGLAGQSPRQGYEAKWVHKDGRVLTVMVFESPLVDAFGEQMGWMGSMLDITERRQLEERERHQAEAMANQARLTTLGEVASALAHQLNQPLTAIVGYNAGLQRMLTHDEPNLDAMGKALRQQGEQAAEAGRIVQRIREFLTRRAPQREATDVAGMVRRVVGLLGRDLSRKGVTVHGPGLAELPRVQADPILVEQVLINLLRNAADAHARNLWLSLTAVGQKFVRIDVDDDGDGLGGRTIEELTTPFYSTKADGMGMGLAICRSVIEVHHGAMDAMASARGGARFSFTLPVYTEVPETGVDGPHEVPTDTPVLQGEARA